LDEDIEFGDDISDDEKEENVDNVSHLRFSLNNILIRCFFLNLISDLNLFQRKNLYSEVIFLRNRL